MRCLVDQKPSVIQELEEAPAEQMASNGAYLGVVAQGSRCLQPSLWLLVVVLAGSGTPFALPPGLRGFTGKHDPL